MVTTPDTRQLTVQDYVDIFVRRWKIIALILILAVGAAAAATLTIETTYRGRAEVLIRTSTSDQLFPTVANGGNRLFRSPQTEMTYLGTDAYSDAAAEALGRSADVTTSLVSAGDSGVGSRIRFENVDPDPARAAEAAQVYAQTYIDTRHRADVADIQRLLGAEIEEQVDLQGQLDELLGPIEAIDRLIETTTDPTELATLRTRRDQLFIQFGVDIARLQNELNQLDDSVEQLTEASTAMADPDMTAVVSLAARIPTTPISNSWLQNLLIALAVGAVLGVGVALLREALDDRTHSDADIRRLLDTQVLGHVGRLNRVAKNRTGLIINQKKPDLVGLEAFRKIRSSVMFARRDQPLAMIQVSSPTEGNGKTRISSNLAVAFAQQGQSVLVIDADLRRPQVHRQFLVTGLEAGLTAVLNNDVPFSDAIRIDLESGVHILPAGEKPPNPSELLGSKEMAQVCKLARAEFDFVIVDSPPLLPVPDSRVISSQVDGVVLVVDPSTNNNRDLSESALLLEQAGAKLIGVVLNRVRDRARGYGHSYGYTYE